MRKHISTILAALVLAPVITLSQGHPPVGPGGGGSGGGGTPGGADTSVQYNNGGAFGGFGTWNGSTLTVPGLMYPSIVPGAQAEYLAYLDGSGTTLHDQSGNGYDCTFAGTTGTRPLGINAAETELPSRVFGGQCRWPDLSGWSV